VLGGGDEPAPPPADEEPTRVIPEPTRKVPKRRGPSDDWPRFYIELIPPEVEREGLDALDIIGQQTRHARSAASFVRVGRRVRKKFVHSHPSPRTVMYGLPVTFDASVFVGVQLMQVSFSANTVNLVFEPEIVVSIEAAFVVSAGAGLQPVKYSPPVQSSDLMTLIGEHVVAATGNADGTLVLEFDNGGKIVCLDDSLDYESYKIRANGLDLVV